MIDTHAHLSFPSYSKDLDQVIERSQENKIDKIICASGSVADSKKSIIIAKKYPGVVFPAIGIHPQKTDPENSDPPKKQMKKLSSLAKKGVVAIGETGLDFSPAPLGEKDRNRKEQLFLFEKQIDLALKKKLPLIIHSREAFDETIAVLEKHPHLKGVFHCYSAGKKGIERVSRLGFYFGVDGNLTYDQGLQNVFAQIPLEKILLETDAPFLTPAPYRGKRNEPKYTALVGKALAKIKGVSLAKIDQVTSANATRLFSL